MYVLTLIAPHAAPLTDTSLRRIGASLHAERTDWLAPEQAADLFFARPPDPTTVADTVAGAALDIIVQPAAGRAKRLLVADMDGTMVTTETLDELAAYAGAKDQIAAITTRSMDGALDFRQALIERVALLRGLSVTALDATWQATKISPGATELVATMRAHGAICALVSGGFTFFASRVAALVGFHIHRANTLLDDGRVLTGGLGDPILDRAGKRAVLVELATAHGLRLDETMAVGDGANDLDMVRAAGMGVAYHARPMLAEAARARVDHGDLRALLFMQGYKSS